MLYPEGEIIQSTGHIELITGPSESGKTEELVRRVKRADIARQQIQFFAPYGYNYALPCSITVEHIKDAEEVNTLVKLGTKVIAIDYGHLIPGIARKSQCLADMGHRVIVSALDMDSKKGAFTEAGLLLVFAETVDKLSAVCTCCGGDAHFTQILQNGKQIIYEPRCRVHHGM